MSLAQPRSTSRTGYHSTVVTWTTRLPNTNGTTQLRDAVPPPSADNSNRVSAATNTAEAARFTHTVAVSPNPARCFSVAIMTRWPPTTSTAPTPHMPVHRRRRKLGRSLPPLIAHFSAAVPSTSRRSSANTSQPRAAECGWPVTSRRNSTTSSLKVKPMTRRNAAASAGRSDGTFAGVRGCVTTEL